jgi:hypothetical protein
MKVILNAWLVAVIVLLAACVSSEDEGSGVIVPVEENVNVITPDPDPEPESESEEGLGQSLLEDLGIKGLVKDAETEVSLAAVTVEVFDFKLCEGFVCKSDVILKGMTQLSGLFGREKSTKRLRALLGKEAIKVTFKKQHYKTITRYVEPRINQDGVIEIDDIYMCRVDAQDQDQDTLCDAFEERIGTRVDDVDSDGDGLSDPAEIYGDSYLDLPSSGADPRRKTIFLELDYYLGRNLSKLSLQEITDSFANAPVKNLDGSTGIDLVIDQSELITEFTWSTDDIDDAAKGQKYLFWRQFREKIKSKHFNDDRENIYYYGVKLPMLPSRRFGGLSNGIPSSEFVVTNSRNITVMHELGHNLGLFHGGKSAFNPNYAINYFSIMNYNYSLSGVEYKNGKRVLDFSRFSVKGFSEKNFNEVEGFSPIAPTTEENLEQLSVTYQHKDFSQNTGSAGSNIDFDQNMRIDKTPVSNDIDGNGYLEVFPDAQNDWDNLEYLHLHKQGDSYMRTSRQLKHSHHFKSINNINYFDRAPCPIEHE